MEFVGGVVISSYSGNVEFVGKRMMDVTFFFDFRSHFGVVWSWKGLMQRKEELNFHSFERMEKMYDGGSRFRRPHTAVT